MDDLPAPSSLLSSRWSRDNLVTTHPGQLYDGRVLERIEPETLEYLVQDFAESLGQLEVGPGRMGVLTWDIACISERGPIVLQVPRVLDERGGRERAVRDVPRQNVENMRHFRDQGLGRFVAEPQGELALGGGVPAAVFGGFPTHHPALFGRGAIQLEVSDGRQVWHLGLGRAGTADVLAELVAALAYHYEPDIEGGTAVTDVCVNDGDFVIKRRGDGSFDLRLIALRRRQAGIAPSLLLLYLIQLLAYEDFTVDGNLVGLPTLMSNPSVAFEGLVRGVRYRARDLGLAEREAQSQARDWIRDFGWSREGRAYRPWVERFLAGGLPLSFGEDLRERWWRVIPLATKLGLFELRGRADPSSSDARSARALRGFLDGLVREIGRASSGEPNAWRVNELGREELERLLAEAQTDVEARGPAAERMLLEWPHRNLDRLFALLPEARGLRRLKSRISLGQLVSEADQGTLRAFAAPAMTDEPARAVANREIFGALSLPRSRVGAALEAFPTFEAYMDSALHDPRWGYYARHVVIGSGGHFETHPERFSPHYGRWLAALAFKAWRDMLEHGELGESDAFPIIEFGAGNGRLARDVLDAISEKAGDSEAAEHAAWSLFASRASYRIYEMSESLRANQRELVGERASIAVGDARRPAATLKRDFPDGVRGFVVTNEVPDAFGVHKVVLSAEGVATVALVVPRAERSLSDAVAPEVARRMAAANATIRKDFCFLGHPDDLYLDRETFFEALAALGTLSPDAREAALLSLWFEEAYVPVAAIAELAEQLATNAAQYALALAAEDSGVVVYVNVHATRFMRELATSLAAGFVVTIDYGDTTFGLVQGARHGDFPFRVYRDSSDHRPRPNDPYAPPGTQDMTADVNFTELARAGLDAGLELVHYGPERDVSGGELPELLRAAADQPSFAKFLGNPVFKLLVLGTRESPIFAGPQASSLPLVRREQDIPRARRQRIAAVERTLSNLTPPPGARSDD